MQLIELPFKRPEHAPSRVTQFIFLTTRLHQCLTVRPFSCVSASKRFHAVGNVFACSPRAFFHGEIMKTVHLHAHKQMPSSLPAAIRRLDLKAVSSVAECAEVRGYLRQS